MAFLSKQGDSVINASFLNWLLSFSPKHLEAQERLEARKTTLVDKTNFAVSQNSQRQQPNLRSVL